MRAKWTGQAVRGRRDHSHAARSYRGRMLRDHPCPADPDQAPLIVLSRGITPRGRPGGAIRPQMVEKSVSGRSVLDHANESTAPGDEPQAMIRNIVTQLVTRQRRRPLPISRRWPLILWGVHEYGQPGEEQGPTRSLPEMKVIVSRKSRTLPRAAPATDDLHVNGSNDNKREKAAIMKS